MWSRATTRSRSWWTGSGSPGGFASRPAASLGWCSVPVHIELTEMLRCPETHEEAFLVMSTGEMVGRMVRSGILGCPACRKEYPIVKGVVNFSARGPGEGLPPRQKYAVASGDPPRSPDAQTLQALLDLSGPGGYVVLLGSAARHAVGLAGVMGGVHFVGIDAPGGGEEVPGFRLLAGRTMIPLRRA